MNESMTPEQAAQILKQEKPWIGDIYQIFHEVQFGEVNFKFSIRNGEVQKMILVMGERSKLYGEKKKSIDVRSDT